MPAKSKRMFAQWSNYNLTAGEPREPLGGLGMTVENLFGLHCSDVDPAHPLAAARSTAAVLCEYIAELRDLADGGGTLGSPQGKFAACTVGQGWSFARLTGTPVAQLLSEGLSWNSTALAPAVSKRFKGNRDHLMIAGGGTRLRELVSVAEANNLSLETGGSHLGQSLAGSCGTGTHGSRLRKGGLQNMVRALHIVTGPDSHVWLQPACSPVLEEADMEQLVADIPARKKSVCCTLISDDDHFDNALIHLGAMGIVNAMVVELRPIEQFNVLALRHAVTQSWFEKIDQGKFDEIARDLGITDREPQFYELTVDPHNIFGPVAGHLVYTLRDASLAPGVKGVRPVPGDALSQISFSVAQPDAAPASPVIGPVDPAVDMILRALFRESQTTSAFGHYLWKAGFKEFSGQVDPDRDYVDSGSWGEIHGDEITGGIPGGLYNASFAIDRANTSAAMRALEPIGSEHEPSFVFTLRFVHDAAGTLRFTRFTDCTVIEIDGLSALAIALAQNQYLRTTSERDVHMVAAFSQLSTTLERGAMSVRRALEAAGIDYSMHWAKLGNLKAPKVLEDYGEETIAEWRRTRDVLLGPEERILFRNRAVEEYGLVAPLPTRRSDQDQTDSECQGAT